MRTILVAVAALISPFVLASPHRHYHHHHNHAAVHERRDVNPDIYVTKWVSVVKTVAVTETVWVTPTVADPSKAIEADQAYASSTPTDLPVHPVESQPQPESEVFPSNESAASPQEPAESQPKPDINVIPSNESATSHDSNKEPNLDHNQASDLMAANSSPPESPKEMAPVSPVELATPLPTLESAPATAPIIPDIIQDNISNNNLTAIQDHQSNAACSSSSPCDGDITYYDPGVGYGACGWQNTKDEPVVALPHEFMGPKSNGNSYCGKTITILRDGKKSTARVVDKCMGCTGFSIDLSDAVFTQLAALSVGRTKAKWWIN